MKNNVGGVQDTAGNSLKAVVDRIIASTDANSGQVSPDVIAEFCG
jgi:hypothetical protein